MPRSTRPSSPRMPRWRMYSTAWIIPFSRARWTKSCSKPYASPLLTSIPAEFKLDPENRALPVDYGDVCINYDKAYFAEKNLALPQSLDDLTNPEYKGLLVVENPATSSPGLAFLLATIAQFGPDGYLDYWLQLKDNDLVVVNDWNTAYYTNFSGSSAKVRSRWWYRTPPARRLR